VRLSVITDEISDDAVQALRVVESMGVGAVEIRVLDGRNIVYHAPEAWRRLAGDIAAGGFDCPVVDSPFLKETPVPGDPDWNGLDWSPFERAVEVADALGAGTVRVFSGRRGPDGARPGPDGAGERPDTDQWLADVLEEAAGRARQAGRRIAVEIEHVCAIATAAEAAAFAERFGGGWGFVLDPGNESYLTGRPAEAGLVAGLAPRIGHVHVKDVSAAHAWVRVGDGIVGWSEHLVALRDSGYTGYLSMETHYRAEPAGLETATRESVAALRDLAQTAGIELR
jgi:L-ribulose-5-phosphate 3-epimerase